MSILINGVEMPTDHPLWIVVHSDGTVEANEVSASRPVGWQTLRNAAVPVPPHGRLIDADALGIRDAEKQAYEALQKEKGEFFTEETLIEYLRGRCDGLVHASGLVRFAPTIIPAEEVNK